MPQSQVTFITHEKVEGASAKGPWTLNIFKTADGFSVSTFKAPVAQAALSTLNQPVVADYIEREPGKFNLNGVEAVNGAAPAVAAPANLTPAPKPDTSTAERIARSHGYTAALKALELANGDAALAEDILKVAASLAYIPAFYTFGDKTVTSVAPKEDPAPAEPTI